MDFRGTWGEPVGRRWRVLQTLLRRAPGSQVGQDKRHLRRFGLRRLLGQHRKGSSLPYTASQGRSKENELAPDRQTGSDTTRFFCLAFCFCWVGGVECYDLSYVRRLTVRTVTIKATCHKNLHLTGRKVQIKSTK